MCGMIRALIFDFDGLILDTEVPVFQSWQEVFEAYGSSLSLATWAPIIGGSGDAPRFDPHEYLEAQLGRPVDREEVRLMQRRRFAELVDAEFPLPGVESYISDARRLGLRIGLASSSTREWVTGHLSKLGLLGHFECIACSDDVERTKPDPQLFHAVLRGLGVVAEQGIVLEDSPNGVLAAKRAGLYCVAVPNPLTRQLSLGGADLRLNSLADMPLEELLLKVQMSSRA